MSKKLEDQSVEFINKLRKRKKSVDKASLIWILAIILSVSFVAIGVVDHSADYTTVNTQFDYVVEEINSQGELENVTYQPIFNQVSFRDKDGFLPENIGLTIHDWIILAIIVLIGFPSVLIYEVEGKRRDGIDENMPYLLREIADAQRIGMTLPRAIAESAKRNYGPLTVELKKLAAKISWGIPFRDAMRSFRDAIDTPMSRQATILILEAERSGGELEKIFDSAQHYVQELLDIKKERESSIKPYIYIIFVSYIIFVVVIHVLFTTFFAPFGVEEIQTSSGPVLAVPLEAFKVTFLYLLMVQAFFSGLVAGKMGKGSIKLGLFYSTLWMIIGLLFYKFITITTIEKIQAEAEG